MIGNLTKSQIENILQSQSICHLSCSDGQKPYVVPVTYAYDGNYIYIQTRDGKKMKMIRKNPNVCIQVEIMSSMSNWQSVIANGKAEELKEEEAIAARKKLFNKVLTLLTSATVHKFEHSGNHESLIDDSNRVKSVMLRIKIKELTGRFEK